MLYMYLKERDLCTTTLKDCYSNLSFLWIMQNIRLTSVKPEGLLGDIKTTNVFHHPKKA